MALDNLHRMLLDNLVPARGGLEDQELGLDALDGWE
jgi:hypothetical protein